MERWRHYLKWMGRTAVVGAALLLAAAIVRAAALGFNFYDAAQPTATALFEIYKNPGAAAAVFLELGAGVLFFISLPGVTLRLGRRTPGLALAGLTVGALASVLSLVGYLMETVAYQVAAAGERVTMLALVPATDVVLFVNLLAEAVAMPAMFLYYPWFIIWGFAFRKDEVRAGRAAGWCFWATVAAAVVTFAGFAARLPAVANAGLFAQPVVEALAWALAGWAVDRTGSAPPAAGDL